MKRFFQSDHESDALIEKVTKLCGLKIGEYINIAIKNELYPVTNPFRNEAAFLLQSHVDGKDERSAMLGNFKFTVLLGCKGTETQEYFSKMIGDKRSLFSAENDAKSQPIIKPSDLAHLKEDLYVLCDDGAVKLKKNYYFKHSAFNTFPPVLLTSKKALAEIHESFSKIMKTNPPSKGVQ